MIDGVSIGEVINLLKDEFPDVSVSKVRFLESQGLVDPHRSASGYRQFFEEDIKRLRFILQQQRDHFLPLKVIKSKLTMWERGEENVMPAPSGPPPEKLFAPAAVPLGLDEIARASGLTRRLVVELIDHGILRPEGEQGQETFSQEELAIAREAQRLLAYGLEPRHLRSVRISTERDSSLLEQLTAPLLRNRSPDARQRAGEILAGCADAMGKMRVAILTEELRRLLES
ncbi:MAG: MerR family DNA-binding transcriptional regulator [Acidimicrobiia bacterium]|nr:MerR family DNA-binding transcriptional regulator [Acidimicrobiia bacterium]MDH3397503.1 MerR family DNA-binding transcriptional regulator [Acidimicrobiia bacterium]MDH5615229.1 MerR family DNA-binding transcriptional regulator [Acidimicrobiia bacterium]